MLYSKYRLRRSSPISKGGSTTKKKLLEEPGLSFYSLKCQKKTSRDKGVLLLGYILRDFFSLLRGIRKKGVPLAQIMLSRGPGGAKASLSCPAGIKKSHISLLLVKEGP